jgi:hypothetical protein
MSAAAAVVMSAITFAGSAQFAAASVLEGGGVERRSWRRCSSPRSSPRSFA